MVNFLESFDAIYKYQFGFRKKHSTSHALLSMVENIRLNLDKKLYSCGVFVDLEKAFDTVNHNILLKKFDYYGIRGNANDWLSSYLSNRTQFVVLDDSKSEPKSVMCGVPQGSILGPLLFLIYINDMNRAFSHSTVHHFADDTNLLYSDKNLNNLKKIMNNELKLLFEWLCANRLSLNCDKTEFIIFRPSQKVCQRTILKLNGHKIYESNKIKYLGILLDPNLSWRVHITELCKKLSRGVGMLSKIQKLCPNDVLKSLYYSLFHSHMSYGISIWGVANSTLMEKVFLLQKRAIRIITNSDFLAHTDPLFSELGILKVNDIFIQKLSSLMWDYDHGVIPKSLNVWFNKIPCHKYKTRFVAKGKIVPLISKTRTFGFRSFKHQGANILNQLKDLQFYTSSKSKNTFLNSLKSSLIGLYM